MTISFHIAFIFGNTVWTDRRVRGLWAALSCMDRNVWIPHIIVSIPENNLLEFKDLPMIKHI